MIEQKILMWSLLDSLESDGMYLVTTVNHLVRFYRRCHDHDCR
jgi:hypothetical protein